ncbi:hypothetical protein BN7_3387 [Wickerhamomyces ciferrii]|uniref:Alpha-1,2-mannosyltransferase n=1 Tax=Wickerhamomyces ciferrii (strain ATCC 14091 / BCRC 22168 / CBS 111 / JCM 3599 / NBRC 0793 / NRRL Y-1031 F-60-10) TaxID=1206466 RepID=K0KRA3_WICCF|nr:uncharacterized protein BN7_3387 [Wickerhamomyces ciferrii]CCH43833.1 hypothetical protein BN7_3387 [Wickerhamomyces ciferrii]
MALTKRIQRIIIVIAIIITVIYFSAFKSTKTTSSTSRSSTSQDNFKPKIADFGGNPLGEGIVNGESKDQKGYNWVFELINANIPKNVGKLTEYKNNEIAKEKFATDDDFVYSREYLSNLLILSDEQLDILKKTHESYKSSILKDQHKSFHSENSKPNGNGIVFVGGIKFSWLSFIGIQQLRILGCNLPIEVFIGDENEYEEEFCENILPKYNARCTVLHKEIGDITKKLDTKISGYQYKNLAFLVSNFENILFLDADNVPMKDPTPLFNSKVMNDHGLVIWPDAWARTTHPKYFEIAGVEVKDQIIRGPYKGQDANSLNLEKDVSFHDLENTLPNPSSESGMILINKTKHSKTLLLSLYYNIFGPKLYYTLFSQGSAGEGDKETFIAAAFVLGNKYYQVLQPFKFIGYHYDGNFNSKALGQADPVTDYENFLKGSHLDDYNNLIDAPNSVKPDIFFMHLSYPKLIPFALLNDDEIIKSKDQNKHIRMYLSSTEAAGYDFELRIFQILTAALCEDYKDYSPISERLIGLKFKEYWGQDPKTFCPQLIDHVKFLKENPE